MSAIEAAVDIERPVEAVFEFYRDFTNLPRFLGDVMAVDPVDAATWRWTIQGPLGIRVRWSIRVTDVLPNARIRYETITAPGLKTVWELYFTPGPTKGSTTVREVLQAPLGKLGQVALAVIGKYPAQEVRANLNRLKQLLETGRVTDTSYAVAGKFP